MKYSLIFGICASVIIPVIYELYANVSDTLALALFAAYVITAGIKFSSLPAKDAMLGMTCTLAYGGVLAVPAFLIIHPWVKRMLEKRSRYFSLALDRQIRFVIYVLVIFLLMYFVWLARAGFKKAIEKFRSNSEKTKGYIDNAFDDKEDTSL